MIQMNISGRQYEIDPELEKYIAQKLGRLDRYLPRSHPAKLLNVELFQDPSGKEDNRYKCTAILELPGPDIMAETATMNPHSAIDIVEQKLKLQIRRYKEKHAPSRLRGIKDRILRRQQPSEE